MEVSHCLYITNYNVSSTEEGVMQALNATSALFGDHNALLKLSGNTVVC